MYLEDKIVRIIPHQRAEAAWTLALEEAVFLKMKEQMLLGKEIRPVFRLYSFDKPSVILGYGQRIEEIDFDFCRRMGIHVTMRTTGGGSVFLGKNDLQYTLILPTSQPNSSFLPWVYDRIIRSLGDIGLSPRMIEKDNTPVIHLDGRSFVFDAQRKSYLNGRGMLLLHHGTTLVDNSDYSGMPEALKATTRQLRDLTEGNVWLRNEVQVREADLIRAFERNIPEGASVVKSGYTRKEVKLATELYKQFYCNTTNLRQGRKPFGICYLPTTSYNMNLSTTFENQLRGNNGTS